MKPLIEDGSSSTETWLDANNRYLADSLYWLRLRLRQLAADPASTAAPPPATPAPSSTPPTNGVENAKRSWFGKRSQAPVAVTDPEPSLSPPPASASEAEQLAYAAAARDAPARITPPPALVMLAQRFGLSAFERDVILMCAAAELDPAIAPLFAAAQSQSARNHPSFALALQAFADPSWDALSPHRPLRSERLIELSQNGAPLTASVLRIDERIVNYLKGINAVDERLAQLLAPEAPEAPPALSDSQRAVADDVLERLRSAARNGMAVPHVHLLGADAGSKHAVAQHVCAAIDLMLYRVKLETLVEQRSELDTLARLWRRERALLPVALYLDAEGLDVASPEAAAVLRGFTARESGVLFVGMREGAAQSTEHAYTIDINKPTLIEQSAHWRAALSAGERDEADASTSAQLLAGQFDLNLGQIEQVAAGLRTNGGGGSRIDHAWDACRDLTRPRLDALAQRLETKATWDDLVLSEESLRSLHQITTHVRGRYQVYERWGYGKRMTRGQGISALFAGESGTGKTMAAEVIANALRLHLYRIDLSAVVSKYIGETEKNLRRLFDAAEHGGAILFFDEADALFGKRSEVKDSHDRYANIEINYLLQRMEAFRGLAILATNMKSALDSAFMRRLRFVVTFAFPGAVERQQMWRKAFPTELPCAELDYERLARFNLSGGNIHSIALNAAFMAAEREGEVTQGLLMSAVRSELRKLDKPINEAELR